MQSVNVGCAKKASARSGTRLRVPQPRGGAYMTHRMMRAGRHAQFKAGKPEGRGIYWSADGDVYEGEFKADKRDHDETNRSLNRSLGASRSANSSAAHSIAASPFHAIQSRSIWDGRILGRGL